MDGVPEKPASGTATDAAVLLSPPGLVKSSAPLFWKQWLLLGGGFLVLCGLALSNLYSERKQFESVAQERLSLGARTVAHAVERRLFSIDAALLDLRSNLPYLSAQPNGKVLITKALTTFRNSVDGTRTVSIYDANGTVTASSRKELLGLNFGEREYFKTVRNRPDAQVLYVAAPFRTTFGAYSLNLARVVLDGQGKFAGIVAATLDPEEFKPILDGLRYTPDVSVGLIHGSGKVLLYASTPEVPPGTDVSDRSSFFSLHLKSGEERSLASGYAPVLVGERLAASHTINPAALAMSAPFVVVVSQQKSAIFAPWYDDVANQSLLLALLAIIAALSLIVHQRHQRRVERLAMQHQGERQRDLERLQLATSASGAGIWELELPGRKLRWEDTMFQIYGKPHCDTPLSYETWRESVLPEDLEQVEAALQKAIDGVEGFSAVFRIRRRDGEIRSIETKARVYCNEAGQALRMIGVDQDVTPRQQNEKQLRESRNHIASILDSLQQHIAVVDALGSIIMVNQRWREFARANGGGESCADSVGVNYLEICARACGHAFGEEAPAAQQGIRRVLDGSLAQFSLEYSCHSPSEKRWFIMYVTPLQGAFCGAVVMHEDISQRKLAEFAFSQSVQVMQQFLDHLPGTAYVKDENLRVRMANKTFQSLLGMDPETMLGKNNRELFPGDFGRKLDEDDRRVLEQGNSSVIEESYDGRFFESIKFVIEDQGGSKQLGGITLDVTERHRFVERQNALLKISEQGGGLPEMEFLQQGLEMIEGLTLSQIGFLHFVNEDQQTIELVTWTHGALKGCTAAHENHYPLRDAGIWADCARQKKILIFNDYPGYRAKKGLPEGHAPLRRLLTVPIVEEGKVRVILGVGNKSSDYEDFDVATAEMIGNDLWRIVRRVRVEKALKQKLEELVELNQRLDETNSKLLQSEKLASLGQLAAGVAHEINNPIGYVSSNLNTLSGYVRDLLAIGAAYEESEQQFGGTLSQAFHKANQLKTECDYRFIVSDVPQLLDESREGLERVRRIVQDLKDFSRVGSSGWQRVNIHQGLESTLNIVWNEIKYKAEVNREYTELPEICCIPSQINQVFLNLLTNAAQAIEEQGHIVLRTGCAEGNVWIEVEDDGAGIDPQNIERIFEPFYTTKPIGKGTGLGLSLSWGIIQRHHGKIEVSSTPGLGTRFRVTLPIDQPHDIESSVETDYERYD